MRHSCLVKSTYTFIILSSFLGLTIQKTLEVLMSNCLGNTKENSLFNFFFNFKDDGNRIKNLCFEQHSIAPMHPSNFQNIPWHFIQSKKTQYIFFLNRQPIRKWDSKFSRSLEMFFSWLHCAVLPWYSFWLFAVRKLDNLLNNEVPIFQILYFLI